VWIGTARVWRWALPAAA
jgi:hypothetical protein